MANGSTVVAFPQGGDVKASEILSRLSEAKTILRQFQWEWWEGIAFYRGDQWTVWDHGAGRLRRRPALPWRIRVTDNQVLPLVQRQVAMLVERRPTFAAMPRTNDEADVLASEGFESLLTYHWDRLSGTTKLADVLMWSLITGNGFWRVDWDPTAGDPVSIPHPDGSGAYAGKDLPDGGKEPGEGVEEEEEEEDDFILPFGEPEAMASPEEQIVYKGDINITVVSPFSFFVDPTATSLENARWCAQESFVHVDTLIAKGVKGAKDLAPDVTAEEFYNYEQSLRFDSGTSVYTADDAKAQVRVLEWYEAPSKSYPQGRVYTVANGRILKESKPKRHPYGGRYPFVHFPSIKVPGRFWADGYVKHLRPLQLMHNRAVSRYHEIMNLMSNPKWVVDKHAGIKETAINDRPGEVIVKNPGSDVHAVTPPPAPTIHPTVMTLAMNAMQTIAGINDPLVGQNPPNVRSAQALYGLQEAAMRAFVPLALQTESAIRSAGRLILNMVQRYYTEDRSFRILGNSGRAKVYHMTRADTSRVIDVTLAHGSMFPKSKAAQQDRVMQLLQFAPMVFADEDGEFNREFFLEMLEVPSARGVFRPDELDAAQADAEHVDAEQGKPLTVQPWENDKLHMRKHGTKMQDRVWVESNPEAAQAVAAHYAEHEAQVMQKMQGQMVDLNAGPQGPQGGGIAAGGQGGAPGSPGTPTPGASPSPFGAPTGPSL